MPRRGGRLDAAHAGLFEGPIALRHGAFGGVAKPLGSVFHSVPYFDHAPASWRAVEHDAADEPSRDVAACDEETVAPQAMIRILLDGFDGGTEGAFDQGPTWPRFGELGSYDASHVVASFGQDGIHELDRDRHELETFGEEDRHDVTEE
jgi:hypothetical protein